MEKVKISSVEREAMLAELQQSERYEDMMEEKMIAASQGWNPFQYRPTGKYLTFDELWALVETDIESIFNGQGHIFRECI